MGLFGKLSYTMRSLTHSTDRKSIHFFSIRYFNSDLKFVQTYLFAGTCLMKSVVMFASMRNKFHARLD